jgi:hypothetical protein
MQECEGMQVDEGDGGDSELNEYDSEGEEDDGEACLSHEGSMHGSTEDDMAPEDDAVTSSDRADTEEDVPAPDTHGPGSNVTIPERWKHQARHFKEKWAYMKRKIGRALRDGFSVGKKLKRSLQTHSNQYGAPIHDCICFLLS